MEKSYILFSLLIRYYQHIMTNWWLEGNKLWLSKMIYFGHKYILDSFLFKVNIKKELQSFKTSIDNLILEYRICCSILNLPISLYAYWISKWMNNWYCIFLSIAVGKEQWHVLSRMQSCQIIMSSCQRHVLS